MAKTVAIGCRLPHGIILEHPNKPGVKVAVKGLNRAAILGAPHAVTEEVDADFWDAWKAANPEFPALKSGALFVAGSAAHVAAIAKELKGEKTGLEALDPESMGVKKAEQVDE